MAKQPKKSIEEQLEELSQKKLELEKQKKAEQEKFYSLIGFAVVKDSEDKNALFERVKKHIKENDIELVKRKLDIKPQSPENSTQTGTQNLSGDYLNKDPDGSEKSKNEPNGSEPSAEANQNQ